MEICQAVLSVGGKGQLCILLEKENCGKGQKN